mgnify:CR=1 FL=1
MSRLMLRISLIRWCKALVHLQAWYDDDDDDDDDDDEGDVDETNTTKGMTYFVKRRQPSDPLARRGSRINPFCHHHHHHHQQQQHTEMSE